MLRSSPTPIDLTSSLIAAEPIAAPAPRAMRSAVTTPVLRHLLRALCLLALSACTKPTPPSRDPEPADGSVAAPPPAASPVAAVPSASAAADAGPAASAAEDAGAPAE